MPEVGTERAAAAAAAAAEDTTVVVAMELAAATEVRRGAGGSGWALVMAPFNSAMARDTGVR